MVHSYLTMGPAQKGGYPTSTYFWARTRAPQGAMNHIRLPLTRSSQGNCNQRGIKKIPLC